MKNLKSMMPMTTLMMCLIVFSSCSVIVSETEEYNKKIKQQREEIEKLENYNNDRFIQINNEIDKLKDLGKTEKEINDERMRGLRIQMTNQSFLNKSKERDAAEAKENLDALRAAKRQETSVRGNLKLLDQIIAAQAVYDKTKEDLISGSTTFSEFQKELRKIEAIQKSIQKEKENKSTIKK